MTNSSRNILTLSLITGVGASFIKKNVSLVSNYADSIDMLTSIGGKVTLEKFNDQKDRAQWIIDRCKKEGIEVISIIDDLYPRALKEIKDPPPIIYVKGDPVLLNKAIAIIGTRRSSALGNSIAARVGKYFSRDWSICNGLVEGIDKHSILVDGAVLPNVIGVLSSGLNYFENASKVTAELADLVLSNNGVLVSEHEPDKKEDQFSGSKASRIQAGLARGLILVQSSISGGSKYTLKAFSELNRPLGVIAFEGNREYDQDDLFGANRLLAGQQVEGLIEICDIKVRSKVRVSDVQTISRKADYISFTEKVKRITA